MWGALSEGPPVCPQISEEGRDRNGPRLRTKRRISEWWGGGGRNWEIGIDMYTLICIR